MIQEVVKLVDWVVLFVTVGSLPVLVMVVGGCVSSRPQSYEATLKEHNSVFARPFGREHPETELNRPKLVEKSLNGPRNTSIDVDSSTRHSPE